MKLRFIIFLHITNRAVYIESTRLYMSDRRKRERKPREKRKESMHSINDSDERAHTLRRYLNDRSANERNVDIQCYVSNNDRQAMYHHYQRHLPHNCYSMSISTEIILVERNSIEQISRLLIKCQMINQTNIFLNSLSRLLCMSVKDSTLIVNKCKNSI